MSTTVDNRVVEMQFDNHQFEKNVHTSLSTLDKLKQALNFDKSSKNLSALTNVAGKFNLDGIGSAVDGLSNRFNALGIVGITALQRITNAAITTGKNVASALTIDPIKTGLEEYETKIGAIQVIRANDQTASMEQISGALNELNTYADKTIYNFAQMTSNVGKFVAQGLGVEEAADAVRGMANLAAASGASPQDMARATYQMSQALGGVIRKIDVNSLRNANMWTTTLKDTLMDVARAEGVAIDAMIEKKGTLEETLEDGWLTGEMFTKAMNIYSGVYDDAQLRAMGFNDEQIAKFQQIAKTAEEAATKIKTFTQLWDTLKENVQSGWTQSWELIIGNFEEAQELWTDVSNILSDFTNKSAEARNNLLQSWSDLGGRNLLVQGLLNSLYAFLYVIDTVKNAFSDIFPPITAERLVDLTRQFRDFTRSLMLTDEGASTLRIILGGVFSVAKIGIQVISAVVGGIKELLGVFSPITSAIVHLAVNFSRLITIYARTNEASRMLTAGFKSVIDFIQKNFGGAIQKAADAINSFAYGVFIKSKQIQIRGGLFKSISDSAEELSGKLNPLSKVVGVVKKGLDGIKKGFSAIGPGIIKVLGVLGGAFDTLFNSIVNAFKNADMNTALNFVKTGLLAGLAVGLKNLVDKIASPVDTFKDLIGGIKDTLGSIGDAFESFTEKAKAGLILKIGIAVGILALALIALSGIPAGDLAKALGAITVLFGELFGMLALMEKFLGDAKFKGATKIAVIMIGLSIAVSLLAGALKKLSSIDASDLGKGLLAVTVLLGEMTGAAMLLGNFGGKIKTSALAMVAFAASIRILVGAVAALGQLDPEQLLQGLFAVGTLMLEMSTFMMLAKYGKLGISTGIGLIAMAASLLIMEKAVEKFGGLNLETIGKGLLSIGSMLLIVAGAMKLMPATLPITATGLILVGAALNVMANALQSFGGMSLPEIGKGLLVLAGSLAVLTLALNGMNGTLAGSAALLIASGALAVLAPVLKTLGGLSMAEIGKALLTMAGAFAVLGVAGAVLAPIMPVILGLSAALLLVSVAVGVASVALTAFTVALSALAVAGPAVVTVITAMIPLMLSSIGEGFAAFIDAIAQNAVTIANAFRDILIAIVTAIGEAIPTIVNTAMQLLSSLLNTFLLYVPQMVDAGLQLITGILQGIASNIQGIVEAAIDIVVNFLEAIASKLPDIIQAGFDMMISFINGLADAIRTNTQPLIDAVNNMFDAVVESAVQFITGSVGRFIQAGKDAAAGLIQGIGSGISGVASAAADMGKGALKGLADAVGWHSPWEDTEEAGVDGARGTAVGFREGTPEAAAAAGQSGEEVAGAYVNSVKRKLSELDKLYNYDSIINKYNSRPKTEADYRRDKSVFRESFENKKKDTEATKDLAKANKDLSKSMGGGGGGGGSAGAAKNASKETKKLFDVMKDGGKIVQKFAENFGVAYQNIADATPLKIGQEAVQKLAEKIYEESRKGKDATEDTAKTAEDKLAAMREAFVAFYDDIKGKVSGAIDEFGKFSEKASSFGTFVDWNKALDQQKVGINSWERELRLLATRTKDYNFVKMVADWGPEQVKDIRLLNSMTDTELKTLVGKMKETNGTLVSAITDSVMSSIAFTTSELDEATEQAAVIFEEAAKETESTITKTAEDGLQKYRVVTKNGEVATTKAQNVIISGNNKVADSFKKVIGISDQLKSKVTGIYADVKNIVESAINSNFDIFEKFDKETELTGDELLENMESRIKGTRDWQSGISELIGKGLNEGLAKQLMAEGTASYDKVKAMLEWSESEIDKANSLFEQSLTIASEVADALGKDMAAAGLAATDAFTSAFGSDASKAQILEAAKSIVGTVIAEFEDPNSGLGLAANAAAEGFQNGLSNNQSAVDQSFLNIVNSAEVVWAAGASQSMAYVAGQAIDGFINTITSEETKARVRDAFGSSLVDPSVESTEEGFEIQSPSKVFSKIGEYCVLGFTNGIYDNSKLVSDASESMSNVAVDSINSIVGSNSQFNKIGEYCALGFADGIFNGSNLVENASISISNTAIDSMKTVVGRIADIVNGEVQVDPTIRPVLDLSDIEAGTSAIDSMLGGYGYTVASGISVQNPNASMNDLINKMMAQQSMLSTAPAGSPINMYVYAAPGQSEEEIANMVEQKLMFRINRNGGVWR